MSSEGELRRRAKEVRSYLKSLQDIQMRINLPGKTFYRSTATLTASKAAVYIMIYNFVEGGVRSTIVSVRKEIHLGTHKFEELTDFWQNDAIKAGFLERASQGTNHSNLIRDVVNATKLVVEWPNPEKNMPFSGNIDHTTVINLAREMDCNWQVPQGTFGGAFLRSVRENRNDLAHGAETFESVGALADVSLMISELDRIRKFLISFIRAVESYKARRKYLRT